MCNNDVATCFLTTWAYPKHLRSPLDSIVDPTSDTQRLGFFKLNREAIGNATIIEHGRSIQHIWRAQHDPGPPPGWVQSTRHRPGDTTCIPARVQVNSHITRATHHVGAQTKRASERHNRPARPPPAPRARLSCFLPVARCRPRARRPPLPPLGRPEPPYLGARGGQRVSVEGTN